MVSKKQHLLDLADDRAYYQKHIFFYRAKGRANYWRDPEKSRAKQRDNYEIFRVCGKGPENAGARDLFRSRLRQVSEMGE